jgi:23S rRNA (guanosine2251-2'-O)-methyltransferase
LAYSFRQSNYIPATSKGVFKYIKVDTSVNVDTNEKEDIVNIQTRRGIVIKLKDAKNYTDIDYRGRSGLVIGAEGTGISRLVRDTCDFIGVLPMVGEIESLNAGVAAAICMYEVLRQRKVK